MNLPLTCYHAVNKCIPDSEIATFKPTPDRIYSLLRNRDLFRSFREYVYERLDCTIHQLESNQCCFAGEYFMRKNWPDYKATCYGSFVSEWRLFWELFDDCLREELWPGR